jgi:hypothetical protein
VNSDLFPGHERPPFSTSADGAEGNARFLPARERGPEAQHQLRSLAGSLRFIRYAFMPNRLLYCGGNDNATLLEHAITGQAYRGVLPALRKFTGAMPYLSLIARENAIADPFDDRVVEAYWIGNELLDRVEVSGLYGALRERYSRQLSPRVMDLVAGKAPRGARPHHSFHVFDVHSRAGEIEHSLATMEHCRISWGRVEQVEGGELVVQRPPLRLRDGRLDLGEPQLERVVRQIDGHGFADEARPGDWVSVHWNWVCEVLDERCLRNLERYTRYHLRLANETL